MADREEKNRRDDDHPPIEPEGSWRNAMGYYPGIAKSPRDSLLEALEAATNSKHATAIMDALDVYLAEPEMAGRAPALIDETPHPRIVIAKINAEHVAAMVKLIAERDTALARAVKAEEELARLREERGTGP